MIVDKIRRYVWLLDSIYRAGERGITFDEINEKWQRYDLLSEGRAYPKRTFEQHKEEIQETFNIEICCDRKTNRYYISDREELKNQNHILKWLVAKAKAFKTESVWRTFHLVRTVLSTSSI